LHPAVGVVLHLRVFEVLDDGPAGVVFNVTTGFALAAAYVCWTTEPDPVPPSPKVHPHDVALVEPVPSNVQVRPEQL